MKLGLAIVGLALLGSSAFAHSAITVQGQIHNDESCDSLSAVTGTNVDSGALVSACAEGLEKANFTNGATASALSDRGTYYIVGTIRTVTEMGVKGQIMTVQEIAKMNE